MKQKLDCMRCIKHDNAVGYIVTADILSGLFIIPLPKAIGASRFQNDLESFEHYLKMRFYSMLLQIAFMACLLLVAINLAAWKKLSWKTSVAVVGGLTLILSGLLVLDLHFHNVLKSALRAYKEHGEIPKMFVKTQNAKARMHPVA